MAELFPGEFVNSLYYMYVNIIEGFIPATHRKGINISLCVMTKASKHHNQSIIIIVCGSYHVQNGYCAYISSSSSTDPVTATPSSSSPSSSTFAGSSSRNSFESRQRAFVCILELIPSCKPPVLSARALGTRWTTRTSTRHAVPSILDAYASIGCTRHNGVILKC